MRDEHKTKKQLIDELVKIRQRVAELETSETECKVAEDRLRVLSSIVDQSSEGIVLNDLEGHLLFANDAFAIMHGYTAEKLVGKHLSIFHTAEQMPSVEAAIRQTQEVGKFSGEIWHVRHDGGPFPTLMHSSLLRDETGNPMGIISTHRDITKHKRAEEELRESEEKYRTVAENSLTGIFIHQDGKYVFVNDRFAEIHAYRPQELLGKEYLTLIHPDEREARRQIASKRLEGEVVPQRYEVRRLRKDGESIWCEMMATRIEYMGKPAIMGNIIDITQRKHMEAALRNSEEKYRRIFETSKDVLYLTSREGKFIDVNQAGVGLFGYSKEELLKLDLAEHLYVHPENRKRFQEMIERDGFVKDYEVEFKKKDKTKIYVSITANVRRDRNGDILGYEGIITDITGRKRAQEDREKLILELQDALAKIKTLSGLLPICASCKKVRDDKGYWKQIETYIEDHSEAEFTHSFCPECAKKLYPELQKEGE